MNWSTSEVCILGFYLITLFYTCFNIDSHLQEVNNG